MEKATSEELAAGMLWAAAWYAAMRCWGLLLYAARVCGDAGAAAYADAAGCVGANDKLLTYFV